MNILIISNIELDTGNASGNTYANWFTGWDDSKIACAYCRDTYPNNDFCDEYYSVSPFNIVKKYIQTLEDWKTLLQTGYKGGLFYRKDREKTGSA